MGQRGPKRQSQTMLKRRGSWLATTRGAEQDAATRGHGDAATPESFRRVAASGLVPASPPPPAPPLLSCPAWLTDESRAIWDQMLPVLGDRLHPGDAFALGRYCAQLVQWRALWQDLQVHGWTELDPKTLKPLRRPHTVLLRELGQSLLALERAFGLTPAARDRLDLPAPEPEPDAKDQFFR